MSPIIVPALSSSDLLTWEWVDPSGVTRALSGGAAAVTVRQATGLGVPPIDLSEDKLTFTSGTVMRHAAIKSREIELSLLAQGASAAAMESVFDDLRRWFATANERSRTPGYLRLTRPDAVVRQIACYYAGGLDSDTALGTRIHQRTALRLLAPEPYWTDQADTEESYGTADSTTVWFPFFPLNLGINDVLATPNIINSGDVDAYPVWTVTGPGTNPTAQNTTSGELWQLNMTLLAGETVVIDTRPSSLRGSTPSVQDNYGNNRFGDLVNTSELWWLAPGENQVSLSIGNATVASSIALAYLPRYWGAIR